MIRQRLLGLGALLLLAGILIGLPTVLMALGGNPLPGQIPSLDQVRDALLRPDDGTLALTAARLLGWVVWALLAVAVLVELVSQIRGVKAPTLPGLAMPQSALRPLVATALALFIATPTASVAAATPATTAPVAATTVAHVVADNQTEDEPSTGEDQAEHPARQSQDSDQGHDTYVVQPGDTLWAIAETHLGSGKDFTRIVSANPDRLTQGADWISPGMELRIPHAARPAQGAVTVVEGDTLSGLAAEHLDDGNRWPELYEATAGVPQVDGRVMSDPDLIYPGWQVQLPDAHGSAPEPAVETGRAAAHASVEVGTAPDVEAPTTHEAPVEQAEPANTAGALVPSAAASALTGAELGVTAPAKPTPPAVAPVEPPESGDVADDEGESAQDGQLPGWVLPGLVGSGALLGGAMFLALAARRRSAFRHRRPGRAMATPDETLAPVEKTVQARGAQAAITLGYLDEVLRRLGGFCHRTDTLVPVLAAAQLGEDALTLHLSQAADLGSPWEGSPDRLHWRLPATTPLGEVGPLDPDGPAPYPLLVSIGTGADGSAWLLNLEDLQVQLTGDPVYVEDLARYLAAEIAVNPWSAGVRLACVGIGEEVVAMNPARLHTAGPEALEDLLTDAVGVVDRLGDLPDVPTARLRRAGEECWPARMLMLHADHAAHPVTGQVARLLTDQPGRTSSALVIVGEQQLHPDAVHVAVGADGTLTLPGPGLELTGVGLTPDETRGCAALLSQAGQPREVPMPLPAQDEEAADPWRAWADQAGALRPEHTHDRTEDQDEASTSLLPESDEDYLEVAATTTQDLTRLAPRVGTEVAAKIEEADPDLDADLTAWWNPEARLPKLTLLGPVAAKTWGKPMADRRPYFTELLAYLALHPAGSTPGQVADAFGISTDKCRDYIGRCREWLGNHPDTGRLHLPHATDAPATQTRGINLYQVLDVLTDADLFRRLRTRAEARGGEEGIADLREALKLVQGRPFDQQRRQGWGWLYEGDRLDQHIVCAIVDVAHIVTTHDLAAGDLTGARAAAEVAGLAGPDEEITALDRACVLAAEGHPDRAAKVLRDLGNRSDDPDDLPSDLPERTKQILDTRSWLDQRPTG